MLDTMNNKKFHTVGTIPKFNRKIIERGNIDIPNIHVHDRSLFLFGTRVSKVYDGLKLVLWAKS